MWELNAQGKLPFLFDRVGRWWGGKDTEIDICSCRYKMTAVISCLVSASFIKILRCSYLNYAS